MLIVENPCPFDIRDMCSVMVKANKIWIIAGAGISVSCGIPDFRSDKGLFVKAKEAAPWLKSGQDMFHKDRLKVSELER
jgi:NAD-dependent SIR2 family protein deacetylase